MSTEDYASYEQASKLIVKGFDWFDKYQPPQLIFIPLYQAQKWLREEKGYHINIWICACGYGWEICKCSTPENMGTSVLQFDEESGNDKPSGMWTTYELALSDAITKAIELI